MMSQTFSSNFIFLIKLLISCKRICSESLPKTKKSTFFWKSPIFYIGKLLSNSWGIEALTPNFKRWSIISKAWSLSAELSYLKCEAIPGKFYNSNQLAI